MPESSPCKIIRGRCHKCGKAKVVCISHHKRENGNECQCGRSTKTITYSDQKKRST